MQGAGVAAQQTHDGCMESFSVANKIKDFEGRKTSG